MQMEQGCWEAGSLRWVWRRGWVRGGPPEAHASDAHSDI